MCGGKAWGGLVGRIESADSREREVHAKALGRKEFYTWKIQDMEERE